MALVKLQENKQSLRTGPVDEWQNIPKWKDLRSSPPAKKKKKKREMLQGTKSLSLHLIQRSVQGMKKLKDNQILLHPLHFTENP